MPRCIYIHFLFNNTTTTTRFPAANKILLYVLQRYVTRTVLAMQSFSLDVFMLLPGIDDDYFDS